MVIFVNEKIIMEKVLENTKPKRHVFKNACKAFVMGGLISLIAQGILEFYIEVLDLDEKISSSLMSMTIVVLASLLTGIGIFDKIGQFSGAGTYIPITGFANSMTSAALESKSEGVILGIMTNMFKLAGAVIVAGVVSATISALLITILGVPR